MDSCDSESRRMFSDFSRSDHLRYLFFTRVYTFAPLRFYKFSKISFEMFAIFLFYVRNNVNGMGQERCSYFSEKSCRIRGEFRTWYLGRWTWRGHGHSGWNGSSSSLNAIRQPQKSHKRNGRSQRYVLQNAHHPRRTPRPRKQRFARPGLPKSLPLVATPSPR